MAPSRTFSASNVTNWSVTSDDDHTYTLLHLLKEKTKNSETLVSVFTALGCPCCEEEGELIAKVYTTPHGELTSNSANNEVKALVKLNLRRCEHTPHHVNDLVNHLDSLFVGFEHYVFMSRVPGVRLYEAYGGLSAKQRGAVKAALFKAIRAVWDCGVDNGSHHLGNVIWDAENDKCYIIDFERATFGDFSNSEVDVEEWGCY